MGGTAAAVHLAALVSYAVAFGTLPLLGLAPALATLAFMLALLALAIAGVTGESTIMLMTVPLIAALVGVGLLVGFGVVEEPSRAGPWVPLHAAASLLGIAGLGVAVVAAGLYITQFRALKGRKFGAIFQLPPLEDLDRINFLALVSAFPVLTVGIGLAIATMDRSSEAVAERLPHLGWGVFVWAALGMVATARAMGWLRGRRAALVSIGGFVALALVFLLLRALGGTGGRFL
jgi:ABC-type transport system involved in cytochrome c biogenesis permease subunit